MKTLLLTILTLAALTINASAMSDNQYTHCHYKSTGTYLPAADYNECLDTYK